MLNQQFGDVYNYQQIGTMREALDLAWPSLVFAFKPGSREAHLAQECLASKILEVVAEGEVNVRLIRDKALRRFPSTTTYYARRRRDEA